MQNPQIDGVPSIGRKSGAPSICGFCIFVSRGTFVLSGMAFASNASVACCVPGMLAFTFSFGLLSGILAKSDASWLAGTNRHGPSSDGARYQRPEINTYVC